MQLISSPQTLTGSWADLGDLQEVTQHRRAGVFLNIDINDAVDVRFRALAKTAKGSFLSYNYPIKTVTSSDVKVEDRYIEFNVDADQQIILETLFNGIIPFVQFQIMAVTPGATPGQIDNAEIEFSNL